MICGSRRPYLRFTTALTSRRVAGKDRGALSIRAATAPAETLASPPTVRATAGSPDATGSPPAEPAGVFSAHPPRSYASGRVETCPHRLYSRMARSAGPHGAFSPSSASDGSRYPLVGRPVHIFGKGVILRLPHQERTRRLPSLRMISACRPVTDCTYRILANLNLLSPGDGHAPRLGFSPASPPRLITCPGNRPTNPSTTTPPGQTSRSRRTCQLADGPGRLVTAQTIPWHGSRPPPVRAIPLDFASLVLYFVMSSIWVVSPLRGPHRVSPSPFRPALRA